MIGPLWRKEMREHGWLLLGLFVLNALGFAALQISQLEEEGAFEGLRRSILIFGALDVLFLCNRLIVREYGARTQLFLEVLPVSRSRVLGSKFGFGLSCLIAIVVLATLAASFLARGRELITPIRQLELGLRSGLYLIALYGFAFFAALLGRFRIYAWGAAAVLIYAIETLTQAKLRGLPFIGLMAERFASGAPELSEVLATLGIAAAFIVASAALALGREGLVAFYLAQQMTSRGRVVAAGIGLVTLFGISLLDERKTRPAFELKAAGRASANGVHVAVGINSQEAAPEARALADRLAEGLAALSQKLGLRVAPPVFVLPVADLDPGFFEGVELEKRDGVVVRSGPTDLALPGELERHLGREVIRWSTRKTLPEEDEWLSDGYVQASAEPSSVQALRVAWAFERNPLTRDGSLLRRWHITRETLGACIANALASAVVTELANRLGKAEWDALIREVLGRRPPSDARALLAWQGIDDTLRRHHAPTLDELVRAVASASAQSMGALREIPVRLAQFESVPVPRSKKQREIHWHLTRPTATFRVLYRRVQPWSGELDPATLRRLDVASDQQGVLPLTLSRGDLLFATIELDETGLDCAVRAGTFRGAVE